jgi:hypothetical protein
VSLSEFGDDLGGQARGTLGPALADLGDEVVAAEVGEGLQPLAGLVDAQFQAQPGQQFPGLVLGWRSAAWPRMAARMASRSVMDCVDSP